MLRPFFFAAITDAFLTSIAAGYVAERFISERVELIGSLVGLDISHNSGIAFGMQLGTFQNVFVSIALVAVAVIAWKTSKSTMEHIGYGFILGGGLANLLDRLLDGYVTDYIQVGAFPIFNLPDAYINVGILFLLLEVTVFSGRHASDSKKKR